MRGQTPLSILTDGLGKEKGKASMQQQETGKAGYIFMALLIAAFCVLIIVFAFQTYLLVNTLFPNDNVFMKWVTVFSFDGCCVIYAGLELFYPFKWKSAKTLVGIMWGATFFGSLLCTIAYMNLSSDHLLHQIVDSTVLIACYAVVTLVFSGDIVAITYLIKGEYIATMAWKYRPRPVLVTPEPEPPMDTQKEHMFTEAQLRTAMSQAYDEGVSSANTRPLVPAPNQQNGNKDGAKVKE